MTQIEKKQMLADIVEALASEVHEVSETYGDIDPETDDSLFDAEEILFNCVDRLRTK